MTEINNNDKNIFDLSEEEFNERIYELTKFNLAPNMELILDFLDNEDINTDFIKKLLLEEQKEKILILDELILTQRELLIGKSDKEVKLYFENCLKLIKQNWNMYPIILNYVEYIKENILRDKLGFPNQKRIPDIRVFEFIAEKIYEVSSERKLKDLTEMVKSYYNHKFKDLIFLKI